LVTTLGQGGQCQGEAVIIHSGWDICCSA